jgi:hypothetical protein
MPSFSFGAFPKFSKTSDTGRYDNQMSIDRAERGAAKA